MYQHGILGRKLLFYIISFSFFITLIAAFSIIYSDYKAGIKQIGSSITRIEAIYLPSISFSLWNYDYKQISLQLDGINNFPGVISSQVVDDKGNLVKSAGTIKENISIEQFHFPLTYQDSDDPQQLGHLVIAITKEGLYQTLIDKVIVILATQFFKTITVSLFILFIVHKIITQHLNRMSQWAKTSKAESLDQDLILDRSPLCNDELSIVVKAINQLRSKVNLYHQKMNASNDELEQLNSQLEQRVEERTADLNHMITRLNDTIEELKLTQNKLIEAEKHAALGQLVAGVAHEINTPLGLCVTTQSYIEENMTDMQQKVESGQLSKSEFISCYKTLAEGMELMKSNLGRASQLINNFKQVAVSTNSEVIEKAKVLDIINHSQSELATELSQGNYVFHIDCDQDLEIYSYPNAIQNVLKILIKKSLQHAFNNNEGNIYIEANYSGGSLELYYKDDGPGVTKEVSQKIFNPFFTTSRNTGDTGLGLHTLYNIVSQVLSGDITCTPSDKGIFFQIIIKDLKDQLES